MFWLLINSDFFYWIIWRFIKWKSASYCVGTFFRSKIYCWLWFTIGVAHNRSILICTMCLKRNRVFVHVNGEKWKITSFISTMPSFHYRFRSAGTTCFGDCSKVPLILLAYGKNMWSCMTDWLIDKKLRLHYISYWLLLFLKTTLHSLHSKRLTSTDSWDVLPVQWEAGADFWRRNRFSVYSLGFFQ